MRIRYARGTNIRDNLPANLEADSFIEFAQCVLADRGTVKGDQWISAPFQNDGRRCAKNAQPRAFLPLDFDKVAVHVQTDLRQFLGQFQGFGYSTASSKPEAPRERAILALSRAITSEECQRIGSAVSANLLAKFGDSIKVDHSVFRNEQPVFTPLEGAASWQFDGKAIEVDEYLLRPSVDPGNPRIPAPPELRIAEGGRHSALLTRAAKMRADGASAKAIFAALEADNQELCSPPLEDREVLEIAQWVSGKAPGTSTEKFVRSTKPLPLQSVAPTILSGADLMATGNAPPVECVKGRIPSGLVVVAGRPKCRKSWLALQIALACASGSETLGNVATKGEVLALLLEDNAFRMSRRLDFFGLTPATMPQGLHAAFSWPTGAAGVAAIDEWLKQHPTTRLVIVDVLARFRGARDNRSPAYDQDYAAMTMLHKLTVSYPGLTVMVIHHVRKGESEDPVEAISGTYAISGAADAMVIFARRQDKDRYHVHVTGRDWQSFDSDFLWEFSRGTGWRWLGTLDQSVTDRQDEILSLAKEKGVTPSQVARHFGITKQAAGQALKALEAKDKLFNSRGLYKVTAALTGPDRIDDQ